MSKSFKDELKRIRGFQREERIENGENYSLSTRTIPSRLEKQNDPRKQRKNKSWRNDDIEET